MATLENFPRLFCEFIQLTELLRHANTLFRLAHSGQYTGKWGGICSLVPYKDFLVWLLWGDFLKLYTSH